MLLIVLAIGWMLFRFFLITLILNSKETFISAQSFSDESLSYAYFVKQGFFSVASYYPDTNNHILSNLICCLLHPFFDSQELTMRLPVLLLNGLLLITIFLSFNKIFNFNAAIVTVTLCGFLYGSSIYGLIGRGFMLMSLFSFISILSVYKYLESKDKFYLYIFILSNILGFYTIPVYLYPFISPDLNFILSWF